MRLQPLLLAGILLLPGCAPAGEPPLRPSRQHTETRIELPSGDVQVIERAAEAHVDAVVLLAPPVRIWEALGEVLPALGLRPTSVDYDAGHLVVNSQRVRGRLGEERLATYFSCGESVTGSVTTTHTLHVTVRVQVSPEGTGSLLRTNASAVASHPASSGPPVQCNTRGVLERRIANRVAMHGLHAER